VPPLRERREDIPLLIEHFRRRLNETEGLSVAGVTREAFARLESHHWPGKQAVLRIAAERGSVTRRDLAREFGISGEQARADLITLARRGDLRRVGRARSTRYVLP